jgi:plastocyanin
MKLKRLIASAFAAAAIVASFAAPLAIAQDTTSSGQPTSSTVNEIGNFTFGLNGPAIAFQPAGVSSSVSQTVNLAWPNDSYPHRVFNVNDQHSYNPVGYSLSITATNLTSGDYFIDKSNLSVKNVGGGPHSSCLYAVAPYNTVVGGNAYQVVTYAPGIQAGYVSLSTQHDIVSAGAGRGCRSFQINLDFRLLVPAGTYTGGGSAVYSGTVTITNTLPA